MKKLNIITLILLLFGLVACQQSDSIWRTVAYNNSIEHSLVMTKTRSDLFLKQIKADVKREGNTREGLERIKRAEQLKYRTARLLGEIDKLKAKLIVDRGDGLDPRTHTVKKPKASSSMKEEAQRLRKRLNNYTGILEKEYIDLNVKFDQPLGEGDKQNKQSFYDTYFKGTNVVEALTSLSHFQARILQHEYEVLKKLGN